MYTFKRLSGIRRMRSIFNPAESCVVLSYSMTSLLIDLNRLVVALAKSQDHRVNYGVFAFADRTPHVSRAFEWMAWNRTPHTDTPLCKM